MVLDVEPCTVLVYDAVDLNLIWVIMSEWEKIRQDIDKIDGQIVKLLNKRARLAVQIAEIKREGKSPMFIPARENEILSRVGELNRGPLSSKALKNVFSEIFSATRSVEQDIKVSCLGPAGSFSHLAALCIFGLSCEHILEPGFDIVFGDVEKGVANFGVVPIENTIEGTVGQTLDLFIESDVNIFGEFYLDIHQNLLSKARSLDKVKILYTHSMPLGQCRKWVAQNLPSVSIIQASSSSAAAALASKDSKSAAIGAEDAAKIYGLKVLAKKIEEIKGNQTRFFIISQERSSRTGNDKTSIMFSIKDSSGALHKILRPFASKGINLSKIQSRPTRGAEWEYVFFVDFDGYVDDPDVKWALSRVKSQTAMLKVLGSYPNART